MEAEPWAVAGGITYLWNGTPPKETHWDIYYYYYATQVFHFFDGPDWHAKWNPAMRAILLKKQTTEKTPGAKAGDIGSYPKDDPTLAASPASLAPRLWPAFRLKSTTATCRSISETAAAWTPLRSKKQGASGRFIHQPWGEIQRLILLSRRLP